MPGFTSPPTDGGSSNTGGDVGDAAGGNAIGSNAIGSNVVGGNAVGVNAVGNASGNSGVARYIVRAATDDAVLGAFVDGLGADPAVRLVDTIGPSAGPPHTAVVETDPGTAELLRQRNQNQLTIEPDAPLSLFD